MRLALGGLEGEGRLQKAARVLEQGKAGIKALRGRPGRSKGRLATCISTDSVMLCRLLGAAGLYGNPQERKGPGTGRAGAARARRCALPPARSRRRLPGLGAPEAAPAPFPLLLSPALLEGLCGRDPEAPEFSSAGPGRAGRPLQVKRKLKVHLVRASSTGGCSLESPGRRDCASLCRPAPPPLPPTSLRRPGPARRGKGQRERGMRKCHDFFGSSLPHGLPTPSFLGFAAAAGERADWFCVKGLHLLSPAGRGT